MAIDGYWPRWEVQETFSWTVIGRLLEDSSSRARFMLPDHIRPCNSPIESVRVKDRGTECVNVEDGFVVIVQKSLTQSYICPRSYFFFTRHFFFLSLSFLAQHISFIFPYSHSTVHKMTNFTAHHWPSKVANIIVFLTLLSGRWYARLNVKWVENHFMGTG